MVGTLVIYTRVSKDPDGTSTSPQAQYDECLALAHREGWDQVDHLSDVDTSAWSRRVERPAYLRVLEGIRDGSISGLVVHHLDRLLRQSRELEALIDAIESRTRGQFPIYSVHGNLDLSTPDGRFQARILVSVAQKESDDKSRRLRLVLGKNARDGKGHGGKVPYGWQSDRRTLDPHEAAVIRELVGRVLDGEGLSELARSLNARGEQTRKGGSWYPTTLKQILTNPRLAGLRTHHGTVVARGDWEPIITPDVHRQLVQILDRAPSRNHHVNVTYWLHRVIVCGVCGHRVGSRTHAKQGRRYNCRKDLGGCGLGIAADPLEQVVATVLVGLIRDHGLGPRVEDVDVVEVEEEVAVLQARQEELVADYYSAQLTRAEYDLARDRLTKKLQPLVAEMERAQQRAGAVPDGDGWALQWDHLNATERADLTTQFLERVVIHAATPGRRFDPTRVHLHLRSDVALG